MIERAFKVAGVRLAGDTTHKFKMQWSLVSILVIFMARKGWT